MVFSRQPVHIIGDPVHDLQLAGFPFYGKCLVCFGWLLLHGRIDLIISEDVAARAPDAEIAVRSLGNGIPPFRDQPVVPFLILLLASRL